MVHGLAEADKSDLGFKAIAIGWVLALPGVTEEARAVIFDSASGYMDPSSQSEFCAD